MSVLRGVTSPIALVVLGLVAVILMAGTFALLLEGRPVPDGVWVLDTAAIFSIYGHGSFLAQNAAHRATVGDLMAAVTAGVTAATPSPNPGNPGTSTGGNNGAESGGPSGTRSTG